MSRRFLTRLLDETSTHSIFVAKIWVILLIVFRVLTAFGGESIYYDELSQFTCNTQQPGCKNACYSAFAPLSHIRFWVFQVIVISIPTVLYLSFAMYKIARTEDDDYQPRSRNQDRAEDDGREGPMILEENKPEKVKEVVEKPGRKLDGRSGIKRYGLMKAYVIQLLLRAILEVAFLVGQYILYGIEVAPSYLCTSSPCPHRVYCYASRPIEKNIFLRLMYAINALSLLFTTLEIIQLGITCIRNRFCAPRSRPPTHRHSGLASQGYGGSVCLSDLE